MKSISAQEIRRIQESKPRRTATLTRTNSIGSEYKLYVNMTNIREGLVYDYNCRDMRDVHKRIKDMYLEVTNIKDFE